MVKALKFITFCLLIVPTAVAYVVAVVVSHITATVRVGWQDGKRLVNWVLD